jgi:opacity protein-like surface antigen
VQVLLPYGGLYTELSAWSFGGDGQRAFVGPDGEVFSLNVPTSISVTPLEFNVGWRFKPFTKFSRTFVPYVGTGVSWHGYKETSDFADDGEDIDDRFTGFQLLGGVEARIHRWFLASGEVSWRTVPNALGDSGVSAAFGESNLGGTSLRFKLLVGQ